MGARRHIGGLPLRSTPVTTLSPPRRRPVAPADADPGNPGAPGWQIWTGLWIVYIVGGSTSLAIRVMVETVPPFLSAGARFSLAGAAMLAFLTWRRGRAVVRPTPGEVLSCLAVGSLRMGANAVVSVAEATCRRAWPRC